MRAWHCDMVWTDQYESRMKTQLHQHMIPQLRATFSSHPLYNTLISIPTVSI
jgi:hypothetical protein